MVESTEPNILPDLARNNLCTHLTFICEVGWSSCWPVEGWCWLWDFNSRHSAETILGMCSIDISCSHRLLWRLERTRSFMWAQATVRPLCWGSLEVQFSFKSISQEYFYQVAQCQKKLHQIRMSHLVLWNLVSLVLGMTQESGSSPCCSLVRVCFIELQPFR